MNRTPFVVTAGLLAALLPSAACSRDRPGDRPSSTEITSGRLAAPPAGVDDTKQSERDKSGASLMTPMDQSNDPEDVALVQEIRKAVVADDTLSTTAKNVRIITSEGHVVLRGAVQSERERETIARKAAQLAGADKVSNQLDVKNP